MSADPEEPHDLRAGTAWLATVDRDARLQLTAALLRRFNHDARTPLNTVLGWTHLLQQPNAMERVARGAEVIARNTSEQSLILDEFIDDARALIGVLEISPSIVPANEVIDAACSRLADVVQLQGIELQPRFDLDGASLQGDAARLCRLIFRVLAAVVRRAGHATTVNIDGRVEEACLLVRAHGSAINDDWSEAALLDLRLATLQADLHRARLDVEARRPGRAKIVLSLPLA